MADELRSLINRSRGKTKASLRWFSDLIKGKIEVKQSTRAEIGVIHNFVYDAKHKDTLPTWDAFPISIPIDYYRDGWLGMNLHYLPLRQRMELLHALDKVSKVRNRKKRFAISYNLLQGIAKSKLYEPTLHRYLSSHVRTKYNIIDLNEDYSNIIHLPPARWQGPRPY